jgi:hypothetical protein
MILELFLTLQLGIILLFIAGFITHNEIIWCVSIILAMLLYTNAYNIQYHSFASPLEVVAYSYPFIAYFNAMLGLVSLVMGLFDIFDKYGLRKGAQNHGRW